MRVLSERTVVPISFLIILLGGVAWLTNLAFKVDAGAESLKKMELRQSAIEEIQMDVGVIKYKIDRIEKKLDRR